MSDENLQKASDTPNAAFPWRLLWLDLLGSLLVAVGFLQFIAQGLSAIALAQMVLGFALMVPLIRHFLKRSTQRN